MLINEEMFKLVENTCTENGIIERFEKENGKILYLKASVETLTERLFDDVERPILKGDDPLEEKVARILHERAPIYEEVADYILEVDGRSKEENAKLALALFEGKKEE